MADKLADARTTRSSSWLFRADDDAPDDDAPARRPTTAARSYSWLFRSDDDETTAAGPQDTAATNDARAEEAAQLSLRGSSVLTARRSSIMTIRPCQW